MTPSGWRVRNHRGLGSWVLFLAFWQFGTVSGPGADGGAAPTPPITKGLVGAKLRERGAHLIEGFDAAEIDTKRWRLWITDPDRTSLRVDSGRLLIEARGTLGHNGLWQLNPAKYKDVVCTPTMCGTWSSNRGSNEAASAFCQDCIVCGNVPGAMSRSIGRDFAENANSPKISTTLGASPI